MSELVHDKIIIVEGISDKRKLQQVVKEPVDIVCTNGTISKSLLDELIDHISDQEIYILVDADDAGEKLRKQLKREFPEAENIYIDRVYREVAAAPVQHLAEVLLRANLHVEIKHLDKG
nr:toprim domain-containing protein [uncultured Bacillus sp.]